MMPLLEEYQGTLRDPTTNSAAKREAGVHIGGALSAIERELRADPKADLPRNGIIKMPKTHQFHGVNALG
jgi:hypothetical protein